MRLLHHIAIATLILISPLRSAGQAVVPTHSASHPTSRADSLIRDAYLLIGSPYKYGAVGPKRFDCTGFTMHLFARYNYSLGRSSAAQARQGRPVARDSLRRGDLVVFSGRRISKSLPGHIGIVVDADSTGNFIFIHACHRGVIVSNFASESYYRKRYITARRVLDDCEFIYPHFKSLLPQCKELNLEVKLEPISVDIVKPQCSPEPKR